MPGFYGNPSTTTGPAQAGALTTPPGGGQGGGFYGPSYGPPPGGSGPTPAPGAGAQRPASGFYGQQAAPSSSAPTRPAPHMPQLAGEPNRPSTSGRNDFGLYYFDDNGPTASKTWGGLTPARR